MQVPVRDGRTVIVTDRFIQTCHDAGLPVHVWTVDEAAAMEELLDMGVDGLMTDQATTLQEVLSNRARPGTE